MTQLNRRTLITGVAATSGLALIPSAARAQFGSGGLGLSSILGKATDSALDKLAQPGAFYNDEEVRIGLPIVGKSSGGLLGSMLGGASRLGILDGITRSPLAKPSQSFATRSTTCPSATRPASSGRMMVARNICARRPTTLCTLSWNHWLTVRWKASASIPPLMGSRSATALFRERGLIARASTDRLPIRGSTAYSVMSGAKNANFARTPLAALGSL